MSPIAQHLDASAYNIIESQCVLMYRSTFRVRGWCVKQRVIKAKHVKVDYLTAWWSICLVTAQMRLPYIDLSACVFSIACTAFPFRYTGSKDLKGKERLEKFLADCVLMGPVRFVCMTDAAVLEAVGSFDNLRYNDVPKGRYSHSLLVYSPPYVHSWQPSILSHVFFEDINA